jgi:hypothetical protein
VQSVEFDTVREGSAEDRYRVYTLYQERSVFGKMKMDPAKGAQTQNTGEVSLLECPFPIR